jgi:hypothetical protein
LEGVAVVAGRADAVPRGEPAHVPARRRHDIEPGLEPAPIRSRTFGYGRAKFANDQSDGPGRGAFV